MALGLANRSSVQVFIETTILIFIAVTALVGNFCVLYVFLKSPNLRQTTSYYHIALAISSAALTILVLPTAIGTAAIGGDYIGNQAGQVIGFIFTALILGSLYTISLISINRFFCVTKPLAYRKYFKYKFTILTICGIWIFCLLFITGVYVSGKGTFRFYPGRFLYLLSFEDLTTEKIFRAVFQVVFIIFPMCASIFCSSKVYRIVKNHNVRVAFSSNNEATRNTIQISRKEIRITKSLVALVSGFIFCWMPCTTIFHIAVYMNIPREVEVYSMYTALSSFAVNPILLNMFNRPFRMQFENIFFTLKARNEIGVQQGMTNG
ncbi:melatonin receptor type 1A-like [Actinia tenebrosa]|uniref:Melatonin receptor type 1A-like n=1 Tax=Actinia tenebrosa TaxID=6105 RepID=A0A6P8IR98_ACTTE|nr:melatonin receptor type 1A-like [Actinia tenebrosa]